MSVVGLEHIKGFAEMQANFAALPAKLTQRPLRRAVAAGARIIDLAAIAYAPVGRSRGGHVAGTLKRAAIVKFARELSNDQQVEYLVTFRQGKRSQKGNRDAFYARWVEFGHRIIPRGAKATTLSGVLRNKRTLSSRRATPTGEVPPHRFLGPAFDDTASLALDTIIRIGGEEIAKALA